MIGQGLVVQERIASAEEYRALRSSVGWTVPESAKSEAALARSLFGVVALCDDKTIGMGRVVGDNELYATIVDVVVAQQCQRRGVGRKIVERLVEWARGREIVHLGVVADDAVVGYYTNLTFQPSGRYLRLPPVDSRR
ncbi:MAG: family acetyltransferase [Nocardia sp.]|uniref:GNAT family N-acetyltransferase n=1 Tax=Nocardia sp. TaxID=1821 RepID=UPI0026056702|nr:GNAT family N-acetyltransferase [Nocardia sp.]MCU1645412.1 family acetyltransferase [Nocardia sp.]